VAILYLDMTQCAMSPLAGDSGYSSRIRSAMHDVLYIVSIRHLYTRIREHILTLIFVQIGSMQQLTYKLIVFDLCGFKGTDRED
jgi:hypothetical protein